MIQIVLEVATVDANTTELGILTVCFKTELSQPLNREATFKLALSNSTTAAIESDFLPDFDADFLTIPEEFVGVYEVCTNVTVFDDHEVEKEEIIVYDVTPLSDLDTVHFVGGSNSITFTIFDDDCKYILILS